MNINITNIGFNAGKVFIGCQIANDIVRGHLEIETTEQEYKDAISNNTLIELVTKYISKMIEVTQEVEENKYINLQEEVQNIKEKNKILEGAIADLGELVALNNGADDIG